MAVPPGMLGLVESAGLVATAYGRDTRSLHDEDLALFAHPNPIGVLPQIMEYAASIWSEKTAALTPLASGADLLLAGAAEQDLVADVAEHHGIPAAGLHFFPPGALPVTWLDRRITEQAREAQRRALGLPPSAPDHNMLEIQAYDQLCVPGLAAQWGDTAQRRPFVGALTLEMPADADDEVLAWIDHGTPPIYLGFGSWPVPSFADTAAMFGAVCAELGERALICAGPNVLAGVSPGEHVKVVAAVNHSAVLPACRAAVHHGGAGTTAAGLRAGVPTLILWLRLDQPLWAAAVIRLGVGAARRFVDATHETLVADLRSILEPGALARARRAAATMTSPARSAAVTADLLEAAARSR
ncbi:putative glycosyltransferase [Mycobacterium parmense]|uniref:Putative glycosyltransferase n=2 Tax=Mycobacterium parmense TaxID=185642 RepID=A0A7I7YT80_9MYCO|nr:putative glycosyltransferase [Mycobacterium parmense]